jgi:hypothetical protein
MYFIISSSFKLEYTIIFTYTITSIKLHHVSSCIVHTELSDFFGVLESIYGFLPVAGGMFGPLTLQQPKHMAKRLIACVSQVMQVICM